VIKDMRLSKQSAPLVDSYDLTVSKDELRIVREALHEYECEVADNKNIRSFHSVHLDDRKQQIYESMTEEDKVKQMKGCIDEIKGLVD
jgi:hypothetical protein